MPFSKEKKLKHQIAEVLNLLSYTGSEQDKIVFGLMDNASARIDIAILDRLTAEEKDELRKIAESRKKSAVLKYLNSKITGLPLLIEQAVKKTIDEFRETRSRP